jgi:hypothetical protein
LHAGLFCISGIGGIALTKQRKQKSIMPVKGYFERAKAFGYLMIVIAAISLLVYLYQRYLA